LTAFQRAAMRDAVGTTSLSVVAMLLCRSQ
jgi:hypothetical protein